MLFSSSIMLSAVSDSLNKLVGSLPDADKEGSSAQAIMACIGILETREREDFGFVVNQLRSLGNLLAELSVDVAEWQLANLSDRAQELLTEIENASRSLSLRELEKQWRIVCTKLEALLTEINGSEIAAQKRKQLVSKICAWEAADLAAQAGSESSAVENRSLQQTELTAERLTKYLRYRFGDEGIELSVFRPLAGGFGKETTLFSVRSESGDSKQVTDYVMRRDYIGFPIANDCHKVSSEYQVIKAVYDRGFPAPECYWLDTDHAELPGGDFIVMKKAHGEAGGNVFGSSSELSNEAVDKLAGVTASLHNLSPFDDLGELTSCINAEMWQLSTGEAVYKYLNEWKQLFLETSHTPSAALLSLYGWLLDHVHDVSHAPVLLHGDIGFHNMLLHDGQITAILDWEFSHVGDPAEELGYIKNTMGGSIDWDRFMKVYEKQSGFEIDAKRIHYFQIWGHVRNATASNLAATQFADGLSQELKLAFLPFYRIPQFIEQARILVEDYR